MAFGPASVGNYVPTSLVQLRGSATRFCFESVEMISPLRPSLESPGLLRRNLVQPLSLSQPGTTELTASHPEAAELN